MVIRDRVTGKNMIHRSNKLVGMVRRVLKKVSEVGRDWSADDDRFIIENYKTMGPTKISQALPGPTTKSAVAGRYHRLVKLKKPEGSNV